MRRAPVLHMLGVGHRIECDDHDTCECSRETTITRCDVWVMADFVWAVCSEVNHPVGVKDHLSSGGSRLGEG